MQHFINVDSFLSPDWDGITPIKNLHNLVKSSGNSKYSIYLWSKNGAEFAKTVAIKSEIFDLITGSLPAPDIMIDGKLIDWSELNKDDLP